MFQLETEIGNSAQRTVALRQLRKLELSSLGWTKRSYENKNEIVQLKQQVRKTAVMRVVNFEN